jgi:glycosyltransferase involved in cell wall biosynthesis
MVRTPSGGFVRVLHVIPSVAPRYGGPSLAVVEMCRALREGGIETLIATTDADGEGRLDVEQGREVSFNNVPAIFFPRQWSEAYKYSKPLARWLNVHVNDFDVAHIHAIFSHTSLAAAKACRKKGVPYVVRPLGTLDPWSTRQKRLRKKVFWHFGVKQMLGGAAAIHYTALPEQKLAEDSLGLAHGVVIPLGVELDSANGVEGEGNQVELDASIGTSPYVLVLSRLHQKKGLEVLLPAFLSLTKRRREFSDWKLVLAGEGSADYVRTLQRLVERENGRDRVVFAGWLEGTKKRVALQRASLLALTSYQENFGLCVVEALACGVPVIVSPHVNLAPEIEAAGAGWVTPLERNTLEVTLAEALHDAEGRARRGAAGRALVQSRFTWSAVAEQLAGLYLSAR